MAKAPAKPQEKDDPRFQQAVQNYESGVKAMQGHKFDRAKAALEKVLEGPSRELADRARMHLRICEQQMVKTSTSFKSPEEHYDYAISLINSGEYDDARGHMEKILKQNPKADFAHYGLAVLDSLTGRAEEAMRNLEHAIRLNPNQRFQARNDSDFSRLNEDPRFTELLYPDAGDAAAEPKKH